MAQYEQPVNQLNFKDGQEPDNQRIEEQFMYKYMQMRPEKQVVAKKGIEEAQTGVEDSDGDNEDPELEKFANEEMDREMRRMASGAPGGMPDSDEEDLSLDEEPMGSSELDDEDEDGEGSDGDGGFFSGEDDLQEVKMSQDEEDDEDGSEGEDLMSEDSYGAQLSDGDEDEEDDEGSDLPEEELTGKQKAKNAALKKKRGRNSEFEGHNMK